MKVLTRLTLSSPSVCHFSCGNVSKPTETCSYSLWPIWGITSWKTSGQHGNTAGNGTLTILLVSQLHRFYKEVSLLVGHLKTLVYALCYFVRSFSLKIGRVNLILNRVVLETTILHQTAWVNNWGHLQFKIEFKTLSIYIGGIVDCLTHIRDWKLGWVSFFFWRFTTKDLKWCHRKKNNWTPHCFTGSSLAKIKSWWLPWVKEKQMNTKIIYIR